MDPKNLTKEYSNGEVTVVWKNGLCIHSGNCVRGLHEVFDNRATPWVNINASTTQKIVDQVKKCPSGALTFYMNADKPK